ncbi:MAG: hydroxymethylglutaryl-CoA lyase [Actinomycetota bacterium]|nr:hydroxymethylglutaryl-CoA lyase [Actinomycetota bacterium]
MDITVVEVSPRDGLQNESVVLPTDAKVSLVQRLVDAGASRIEAVSFAHPKLVPAMADAEEVMAGVPRVDGVSYAGLILNRRGLERALGTGIDEVNVVVGVSDTFSRRNQNVSSDEAMDAAGDVVAAARAEGLFTTLTLATSFGCPFEGDISPDRVLAYAERGAALGSDELCLADTIGVGTPNQVRTFTTRMRTEIGTTPVLRYHFHNTRGTGIANAYAALLDGVSVLDASVGGIGGCPFAPDATGNIATDDLVYLLDRMGLESGIDLERLMPTSAFLAVQLGHEVPALLPRAGNFPPA